MAAGEGGAAPRRGTSTASTPAPSAVRTRAPKFRGSSIRSSRRSRSGFGSERSRSASVPQRTGETSAAAPRWRAGGPAPPPASAASRDTSRSRRSFGSRCTGTPRARPILSSAWCRGSSRPVRRSTRRTCSGIVSRVSTTRAGPKTQVESVAEAAGSFRSLRFVPSGSRRGPGAPERSLTGSARARRKARNRGAARSRGAGRAGRAPGPPGLRPVPGIPSRRWWWP